MSIVSLIVGVLVPGALGGVCAMVRVDESLRAKAKRFLLGFGGGNVAFWVVLPALPPIATRLYATYGWPAGAVIVVVVGVASLVLPAMFWVGLVYLFASRRSVENGPIVMARDAFSFGMKRPYDPNSGRFLTNAEYEQGRYGPLRRYDVLSDNWKDR
jgi:hypothetical protein